MNQESITQQINVLNESLSKLNDEINDTANNIERIKNEIATLKDERNEYISENLIGQTFEPVNMFIPIYYKILETYNNGNGESMAKGIMCRTYDNSIGIFIMQVRYLLDEDDYTKIPLEAFDETFTNIVSNLSKYLPELNLIATV